MHPSFGLFVSSLLISQRLLRFSKINNHAQWERMFRYAKFFSIFLFVSETILSASNSTRWIWHILLISLIVFAYKQNEMRAMRMFLLAFAPYVLVSVMKDLTEVISKDFYNQQNNYFNTASLLSVIWAVAILFTQYRQIKIAEKERIKRQKEDEINMAIARRKVELEELVAERTAELTNQKEELEQTLNELRTTQAQLIQSEKMASLGELTAGIAHEIQNPLNFVNNFSEVNAELIAELEEEIKKRNRDFENEATILKDLKENELKIIHHGKRAEAIVKGMLLHSRSSTGKKEPTDINALADEYLRLSYHGLRAKDKSFTATMETDFSPGLEPVNVIPQDMGRVILNLINNAFYAVTEKKKLAGNDYKPTVWVSTKKINANIELRVKDNGIGIPQKVLDKIFQPFFTTKPSGQGTGLGLSMSYDIIKAHGGELKVETKEGEGSVFIILLMSG
ncbi:MAG: sensor histidine kinase [Methylococcaceae bacterium]|nr:ATP-binding protein [Prolixibacteraceae bacterium]